MSLILGFLIAIALAGFSFAALTRGPWALLLVLLQFPAEQLLQSYYVFFVANPEAFNIAVGLISGTAVLVTLLRESGAMASFLNTGSVALWVYVAYAAVTVLWSPLTNARPFPSGAIAYVVLFLVIGPILLNGTRDLRTLMTISLVLGTVLGLLIVSNPNAEFIRGRYVLRFASMGSATDSNPLAMADLGGYIAIISVLSRFQGAALLWFFIRGFAVLIGTILLLDSGSRGQVIMAGVVIVAFYPIAHQIEDVRRFIGRVVLLGLVVIAVLFASQYLSAAGTERRWESDAVLEASQGRIANIGILLSAWFKDPTKWLQGLGNGAFASLDTGSRQPYVHNVLAEALGEFGIVGLVLLGTALMSAVIAGRRLFVRFATFPFERADVAALLATATFSFLVSNKQGNIWVSMPTFMLLILVIRFERITRDEEHINASSECDAEESDQQQSAHAV
jgi:hypothetical protein